MSNLPTRQARVAAIALHLAALRPRDTITHEQIRDEVGIDTSDIREASVFADARRKAVREHGCVLKSIRSVGYARLTDAEIADDDSRVRRVRSQAKRGLEELMTVNPSKIGKPEQAKLAAKTLVLAAVVTQTKPSAIKAMKPVTSPSAARALLDSSGKD